MKELFLHYVIYPIIASVFFMAVAYPFFLLIDVFQNRPLSHFGIMYLLATILIVPFIFLKYIHFLIKDAAEKEELEPSDYISK